MKMILTAGALALALMLAAVSTVNAKSIPPPPDDTPVPTVLIGE